jgi:hypothetical protein
MVPDARFIYVLRNPVDRIYSHFLDNWIERGNREPFDKAVLDDASHYVNTSRYYLQLSQYLDWFPASRIHIVIFEKLIQEPLSDLTAICDFLNIDPRFPFASIGVARNVTSHKRATSPVVRWLQRNSWYKRIPAPVRRVGGAVLDPYVRPKSPRLSEIRTPDRDRALFDLLSRDIEKLQQTFALDLSDWNLQTFQLNSRVGRPEKYAAT